MQKSGLKLNKLNALVCKQLATPENNLILNDSNTLLLSINGNCMEFCFIYVVWWFFETKAFCALPKKAKISKLQRLKIGLGMSNIELK